MATRSASPLPEKKSKEDVSIVTDEKKVSDVEKGSSAESMSEADYDPKFVKKTLMKVDLRLLPILGAIYAFSLIDRTNLANVRVAGADFQLRLAFGNHYSIVTLVFFIPYIILEIPSNIVFRRVGARLFLGTIGLLWGVIMLSMGFVKTWNQLAALRGLLGMLEAGFFPACIWLISCWYTRAEVQTRLASFYLVSVLFGSFSSIIAYGLQTIHADHIAGWRWILIVEGIITCVLSILGYFLIVDFPDKNTFLTKEETELIKLRVERDRGDTVHDPITFKKCLNYALDVKLWGFAIAYMGCTTATYAFGYFAPVILIGMGFSVKEAQLLVAPAGIAACLIAIIVSRMSDRYRSRGPFVVFNAILTIIGLAMTAYDKNNSVRFAGGFFAVSGTQGNIPALLAYQSNNIRGQSKRAFSSALQVTFGGVGGIIAALIFRQQDAPKYVFGMTFCIALQILIMAIVAVNSWWFARCNREAREGKRIIEDQPGFLYTL